MKKVLMIMLAAGFLASCNNSAGDEQKEKVDSLEKREDTLKNMVDSSFDTKIDSLKERKEDLKDKVDSATEARKDSLKGKKS